MFLIVTTIENGRDEVSCVPEGWVRDNSVLLWPPKGTKAKKIYKMRSKEVPPEDNWESLPCKVRDVGPIHTFIAGLEKEKFVADFTDTDSELRYVL